MSQQPDVDAVERFIVTTLHDNPVGASTRFTLAEGLIDRYPSLNRDEARSLISRILTTLQQQERVRVLRPESWDFSGDERVRLV